MNGGLDMVLETCDPVETGIGCDRASRSWLGCKKKRISQKAAGIERRDGFGTGTQIPTVYGGWGGRGTSQVALVGSNPLPTQVT